MTDFESVLKNAKTSCYIAYGVCWDGGTSDNAERKGLCKSCDVKIEWISAVEVEKLKTEQKEFLNEVFGRLKGTNIKEREKEVKLRLLKLQNWLVNFHCRFLGCVETENDLFAEKAQPKKETEKP